jgi:sarcosine oxidase subunit beta
MNMPQATADVVIIGAGVAGCSTAYHLARMGITDVTVVEMEQVGSGTSGKSASMLSLQFCQDELALQMARYAYDRYMQFEQELGVPIDFRKTGWLSVATLARAENLLDSARLLQSLGVTTEILGPEEIKRRYPELATDDLAVGTFGPDDGSLDPHMIMWGYIKRATELGVRLHQGVRATGIQVRYGRVQGVETTAGPIETHAVVNAAGPWAIEVGRWAGVEIPILNRARSILVTQPFPAIPSDRPFVEDVAVEWYARPEGPGMLMGMGQWPVEDLSVAFTRDMMNEMIEAAVHRVPVLEHATMLTGWTGVRPMTADSRPILGKAPGVEGLILNCGWGGRGIIQAPAGGQLVAELIQHGHTLTMDIRPFNIERPGK